MTNLELWGVDVDVKSYEQKWTIHSILQNMGFYPPTENPSVMMKENIKTKSSGYIVIYREDLYIAPPTPEKILQILQDKYKINLNQNFYLGGNYPHDPSGTMICQLKKYLEKLYVDVAILFKDRLQTDLQNFPKNHDIIDHQR